MLTILVEVSAHSVDTYTIACIFLPLLKVSFSRIDTFRKLKRRSKSVADLVIFLSYFHLSSHTVWPILCTLQKNFEKSFKSWKCSYKKHNVHTHKMEKWLKCQVSYIFWLISEIEAHTHEQLLAILKISRTP